MLIHLKRTLHDINGNLAIEFKYKLYHKIKEALIHQTIFHQLQVIVMCILLQKEVQWVEAAEKCKKQLSKMLGKIEKYSKTTQPRSSVNTKQCKNMKKTTQRYILLKVIKMTEQFKTLQKILCSRQTLQQEEI